MVMNHNEFGTTNIGKDKNQIIDAAFTTKGLFHNTNITIGRYDWTLGQLATAYFVASNGMTDGVEATYTFGKASLRGGYACI